MVDSPYTYAYSGIGNPSSIIRYGPGEEVIEFPQDPGNADYQAWLAFEDGGGTTDPAPDPTLTERKNAAKALVNAQAGDASRAFTTALVRDDLAGALRYDEAVACAADVTPTDEEYPMLAAEVPATAATLALVATAVLAENLALRTSLGAVEEERQTAYVDIDACADQGEIDAVLAAITWPEPA